MEIQPYYIIMPTGLVLGLLAGFFMHRSDFCVAGMFRDAFLFNNIGKLAPVFLVFLVSMATFELARLAKLLSPYPFPLIGSPSAANLIGGLIFGFGMVLAGGCVVGTLYKIGAGSMLSMVAFVGILLGSALYAEIHPIWIAFMKDTTFFGGKVTVSQVLNIDPSALLTLIIIPLLYVFYKLVDKGGFLDLPSIVPEGYIHPLKTAVVLGLIGLLSYIFVGMPVGVTTTYTKLAGLIESWLLPQHFESLNFFKVVSLKYTHSLTGAYLTGGPAPVFDAITAIQLPVIVGIIAGSFFSALSLKEFRIYYNQPLIQYLSALVGGVLIGLASRLSPACNVWHLFGGLPIFAIQSILFLIGLLPGAWIGGRFLLKFILR